MVEPTREFGYRDLGIIQDFRRQYVESRFPRNTNDLNLAIRLYHLRRQFSANPAMSAQLDSVFTNIVSGNLAAAGLQMDRLSR